MNVLNNISNAAEVKAQSPAAMAVKQMQCFVYDLRAVSFTDPRWDAVTDIGLNSMQSLGCSVDLSLNGNYTMRPTVYLNSNSLLLLSPEVDAATSFFGSFGSLFSMIGDCFQKEGDQCNALQIVGCILLAIAAIVMYGVSIVKSFISAGKIIKLNKCIRTLKKQVAAQQGLLSFASQLKRSEDRMEVMLLSTQKFSDNMTLQANKHLIRAFTCYRAILITNLVEKTLFALLITSIICFVTLAAVFGVTTLPCIIMGGCAAGFVAAILALALVSCICLRKQVKECTANMQKAWLHVMTSELILKAPEALRRNISARLLIVKRFVEEQAKVEQKYLNALDLKILMARIGFPPSATTGDDEAVSDKTLRNNFMSPDSFFN